MHPEQAVVQHDITDMAWVYPDKSNKLTIEDILSQKNAQVFLPHDKSKQDNWKALSQQKNIWYRFDIPAGKHGSLRWLTVSPVWFDHMVFYQVYPDGSYTEKSTGRYGTDAYHKTTYIAPSFQYQSDAEYPTRIYIKVQTRLGKEFTVMDMSADQMLKQEVNTNMLHGVFFGIYCVLILISLWFERVIRDGVYGIFAAYVFFYLVLNLGLTGWWYGIVDPLGLSFLPIISLSMLWITYFASHFYFRFVHITLYWPRLYKVYMRCLLLYCIAMSISAFTVYEAWFIKLHLYLFQFGLMPLSIAIAWKPAMHGDKSVRKIVTLVILILFGATTLSVLSSLNLIPYKEYFVDAPIIGTTIVFLLIFYGLSKVYKKMRDEKDVALQQLLVLTQQSEQDLMHLVDIKTQHLLEAKDAAEEALYKERQAHEEQRNFVSMVSHEFRTPLAIIDAARENITFEIEEEHLQKKLKKIETATERLTSLVDHYLTKDRLNIFVDRKNASWLQIDAVFNDIEKTFISLSSQHTFTIIYGKCSKAVYADMQTLKLVLSTLIENAVKYTPAGTKIQLKFSDDSDSWFISVSDNGPGVGDEKELIFKKFYRGRSSSNKVGSGLGLTLARNLIEMQGGQLTLKDSPFGQGCCFEVKLQKVSVNG